MVSKISIDTQKQAKDWRVIGYTDWMADVNHGMIPADLVAPASRRRFFHPA